jgi:MSHA biogenesis protein MshP
VKSRTSQSGFGVVSAVFILVILAFLTVSIVSITGSQRAISAADLRGSRAYQAARAGIEWGAYQALVNGACAGQTSPGMPAGSSLAEFTVTVRCTASTANEGGATVTLYNIEANACNVPAGGACPNAASNNPNYVERQISAVMSP